MTTRTPNRRSSGPRRILLIEDDPDDVERTKAAFEATSVDVAFRVITDGEEALEFLLEQAEDEPTFAPDLVLLNLHLPGKDGREILEVIRDESELRALPVIVLSSSETSEDIVRCYDVHANAYLTKPTNHEEYVSLVRSIENFWLERVQLPTSAL